MPADPLLKAGRLYPLHGDTFQRPFLFAVKRPSLTQLEFWGVSSLSGVPGRGPKCIFGVFRAQRVRLVAVVYTFYFC